MRVEGGKEMSKRWHQEQAAHGGTPDPNGDHWIVTFWIWRRRVVGGRVGILPPYLIYYFHSFYDYFDLLNCGDYLTATGYGEDAHEIAYAC